MTISTAVDPNARASIVGIDVKYQNLGLVGGFLPQRVAIVGQGSTTATYDLVRRQITSAFEAGQTYGFGSPIHLSAMQILPDNGDGVGSIPVTVYPLEDDVSGIASAGEITPSGIQSETAAYRVSVAGMLSEAFIINAADSVAVKVTAITEAINASVNLPIVATDDITKVDIEAKWKGESGNDIIISIEGSTTAGTVFAIVQPTSGDVNPDVDGILAEMGNTWETLILNCLNKTDIVTLEKFRVFGEGRWQPLVKKPLIVFSGDTNTTVANAVTIPEARKTDRINSQLVAPGSVNLPFVIASRELAKIAVIAEANPPKGYNKQIADGILAGANGDQWTYIDRDEAVKKGSSTITVEDSVIKLGDIVTFYHPTGDPFPSYSKVVAIIKLMNIIYNLDLEFESIEWADAPLIPDNQPTVNPDARTPSAAKAEVNGILDYLGTQAIISDPETAKKKTTAQINPTNPDRLDIVVTVQLSGNSNIKAVTINFGYFVGGAN